MSHDNMQQEAINTTGTNILVSASAGAGKTRVLVDRLVKRCFTDRISVEDILAVTFTAAAAAEMKNRVASSLNDLLKTTTNEEDIQYLKQQIILLDSAEITTIDAFCLKIIKKYYNMIGLDPATATNILSEGELKCYQDKAFLDALCELLEEQPDNLQALFELYEPRCEEYKEVKQIVFDIVQHAESSQDPIEWLEQARNSYTKIKTFKDFDPIIQSYFYENLELRFYTILDQLDQLSAYAPDSDKLSKGADKFERAKVRLLNCKQHIQDRNYDMFKASFITFGEEDFKIPTDGKQIAYTDLRKEWFTNLEKLTLELYDLETFVKDNNDLIPYVQTLIDLACKTRIHFQDLKRANACMDFSDMERYAYQILQANDYAVSKIYKERFKEVMVDEFQDTSTLQNEIIETLSMPGTIFRVGDVKQSIYRFRGAKPDLMRSIMQDENTHQIVLEHNYRSRENIVKYCNLLFGCIMNVPGCKDVYSEKDIVSTGAPHQLLEKPDPCVIVQIKKPEANNNDNEERKISYDQMKAEWIAEKIYELKETDGYSFKDFAVLVRNHGDKMYLKQAFDYAGIPYNIDTREGFFNSDLALTILAIYKCMLNPKDEISLLTVLTSNLYRFNDNQLAQLKIKHGSIYKGIKNDHPNILEDLNNFNTIVRFDGLLALLNAIACHNDFFTNLSDNEQANFDFLFEKTQTLAQNKTSFLDLVNFMEAAKDEKSSEAMAVGRNEDIVEVTTIHQSKGLQYKVVFLYSTSRNAFKEAKEKVLVDDDLYLGLNHYDLPYRNKRISPRRMAITYKNNLEDLEEYTRLLYVALTRPMHKLYIVDMEKDVVKEDMSIGLLNKREGFTNLILSAQINDPDLFVIETYYPINPIQRPSLQKTYAPSLPVFNNPNVTIFDDLKTPSASKASTTLAPLTFQKEDGGTNYGTFMHELMESMPNRLLTSKDLEGLNLSENDASKVLAFHTSDLYKEALNGTIYREFPFYIEQNNERLHGIMDFVSILDDKIILVDYKTDHADEETIKERYTKQLNAYKKALNTLYENKDVKAYAYSFYLNKAIEI